jgi:DNA-binding protein YbaB
VRAWSGSGWTGGERFSDLVMSAIAEAQRRASDLVQAEMRKLTPNPLAAL